MRYFLLTKIKKDVSKKNYIKINDIKKLKIDSTNAVIQNYYITFVKAFNKYILNKIYITFIKVV